LPIAQAKKLSQLSGNSEDLCMFNSEILARFITENEIQAEVLHLEQDTKNGC
jgi:hypothetical protein